MDVRHTVFILGAILTVASLFYLFALEKKEPPPEKASVALPQGSLPQSAWSQVVIPAGVGKRSQDIPLPLGMHHIVTNGVGNGSFKLHSVYGNGRQECTFGNSCPDGDVTGYYLTNEGPAEKTVLYAFVPIGR